MTGPLPFDRELWLEESEAHVTDAGNWRNRMVDDVARRWVFPNMRRSAVIRLLGSGQPLSEEDYRSWTADTDERRKNDPHPGGKPILAYWTHFLDDGEENGSGATEYLYVFFDAKDRVVRTHQGIAM